MKLSAGASLTLAFKGNLFDLTTAERELVADLSNIIQKYKDGAPDDPSDRKMQEAQHG
jgi:hypothetical protein